MSNTRKPPASPSSLCLRYCVPDWARWPDRPTRVSSSAGSSYATSWAGDTATHKRRPGLLRGDSVATHARVPSACGRVQVA